MKRNGDNQYIRIVIHILLVIFTMIFSHLPVSIASTQELTPLSTFQQREILIIADQSISMNELVQGKRKTDYVFQGLSTFLDSLPPDQQIGLRVFGSRRDCRSTELIVPIGPNNINKIKKVIASLVPSGNTPLALALEKGVKDFGSDLEVEKIIVLLTDGHDTCNGDPCKVIDRFKKENPQLNVSVDVVGIIIDDRARKQLRCIAKYSGGHFREIKINEIHNLGKTLISISAKLSNLFYRIIAATIGSISLLLFAHILFDLLTDLGRIRRSPAGFIASLVFIFLDAMLIAHIFSAAFSWNRTWTFIILFILFLITIIGILALRDPEEGLVPVDESQESDSTP